MLYICIPAYNEAPTIGLLLWRIRKVLADFPREYEVLVYDDGSSDGTGETLQPYGEVLPLTVIGGERTGYAAALDALLRTASARTRYPRRDAVLTMQGDFTDAPDTLPEVIKRFEGGADVVVAERALRKTPHKAVRRLRQLATWAIRPFVRVPGVDDPFGTYRLYRISVIRDAIKSGGNQPLATGEGWAANLGLMLNVLPHARRIETVTVEPRYDLRPRDSRIRPWNDALSLFHFGRAARSGRTQSI